MSLTVLPYKHSQIQSQQQNRQMFATCGQCNTLNMPVFILLQLTQKIIEHGQLCFVFATLKNGVTFHLYLENIVYIFINRFHATGFFLYPLKTSENQRVFYVCRGYRKRPVARNGSSKKYRVHFPAIQTSIKVKISPPGTKLSVSLEVSFFLPPASCLFISYQDLHTLW